MSAATDHLAALVRAKARGGRAACVVGHSMGAHVALAFGAACPELVGSHEGDDDGAIFVSGLARIPAPLRAMGLPCALAWAAYAWTRAESLVPEWAVRRALGLVEEGSDGGGDEAWPRTARTLELCRGVVEVLVAGQETRPLKARTLVVAATKGGVVPTDDNVDAARDAWKALSQGNAESRAVKIASTRHPWNEQDPKLFAESILAWMEKRALPEGFEDL